MSLVTATQMNRIVSAASRAYKELGAHSKVKPSDLATEAMDDYVARWVQRFGPAPDEKKDPKGFEAYVEKLKVALDADGIESLMTRKVN